jgi:CheY-like chemotaxis protein
MGSHSTRKGIDLIPLLVSKPLRSGASREFSISVSTMTTFKQICDSSRDLPCVAIIADDADFLEFMQAFVRRLGYRVKAFNGCDLSLNHGAAFDADLLLTDLFMPDLDGLEILRLVGRPESPPPIILMTDGGPDVAQLYSRVVSAFAARSMISKTDIPKHLPALLARILD